MVYIFRTAFTSSAFREAGQPVLVAQALQPCQRTQTDTTGLGWRCQPIKNANHERWKQASCWMATSARRAMMLSRPILSYITLKSYICML